MYIDTLTLVHYVPVVYALTDICLPFVASLDFFGWSPSCVGLQRWSSTQGER